MDLIRIKKIERRIVDLYKKTFLSKNDIGLSNVDNTSDLNKPISIATQSALDLKADKLLDYIEVSEDYVLTSNNRVVNFTSGSYTATLPSAIGVEGKILTIINTGNGVITLDSLGVIYPGETIDLISNNTNWIMI
jgi:hypothetical protein